MDMETSAISPDQPHIHRLTRMGAAAVLEGRGLEFLDQAARIIWDGTVDGWDHGPHLAGAAGRAGLEMEKLDRDISADADKFDAIIGQNQADHEAAGHWGVPTMVFEEEPFFGQDRLGLLLWRMRRKGLKSR